MMQLNLINNEDKEIENIFILAYSIVSDFNIYFYDRKMNILIKFVLDLFLR
jgi:hypothetical protein